MFQFASRKAIALSSMVICCSLPIMKSTAPTFYGLRANQVTSLAKKAVANAVADNARAGISLTGLVDGRVQKLQATAPRIAKFLMEQSDAHAG
ncbi:hypothetical protein AcdelDRAFT_0023 [Acidovorax delafieldii 2AN]|uniref:Uncharacterized protein n=1 Tax=Acidovorax delafieldii 2AN TaxID=573060 RepID=C5SZE3_ACIDE|nr:hypothetical protein [Acidovorax delafieldii]EER62339.1 hypothetical protein AcdelDRAFT_0023 [Acidovorax delafieldii 2AN]